MAAKIVVVTGAAGQIGYAILPMIASGQIYGPNTLIHLRLLDIQPMLGSLKGVQMELEDCAYPLVTKIEYGADPKVVFKDADLVICLGGFPRKVGMERKELLLKNMNIFKEQGRAANSVCKESCKFLVVANPANTNCTILAHYASKIPKNNFSALTRLDHNRAIYQIAQRSKQQTVAVKNVIIWGNHSSTQYPDVNHGTVNGVPIRNFLKDDPWLVGDFISVVQKRGAAIIEARKNSSAMSAANAAIEHCRDWVLGTKTNEWVSMAVISQGEYGIQKGLCYSYPVICSNGNYQVKTDLKIDSFSRKKMDLTEQELIEEKAEALGLNMFLPAMAFVTSLVLVTFLRK